MFYELMMKKKGIPSRYQEVEYIESTGTQYIDTGVYGKNTTDYEIKWNEKGNDTFYAVLGARLSVSEDRLCIIGSSTTLYISNYSGTNPYQTTFTESNLRNKDIILKKTSANLTLYGDTEQSATIGVAKVYQTPTTLKLGCIDTNGALSSYFVGRIYYCKLYDNNRLARNFIPVYDTETQKYGMWESVQCKFYGNDGTGDFKGSIVGYTVVGSPTITDGVVSGFSASNYLQINSGISVGQNFEIYTKFTTGASLSSNQELMVGKISSDFYLRIFIQNGATLFTSTRVVGASSISHNQTSYSFQTNTTYFVKVKYDGANKLDVFIYDNTGQQVKANSFTLSNQINTFNFLLIGTVGTPSSIWGGSIDLNETYIKADGKLWFNGQQA